MPSDSCALAQARSLQPMARQTHVELVVTSPMARAIQTATLAFAHVSRQASAPTEYCCEYCNRLPQWPQQLRRGVYAHA